MRIVAGEGKCLPSSKGYLSFWGQIEAAVMRAGGNLSSSLEWPIDQSSPPLPQSKADARIGQSTSREVTRPLRTTRRRLAIAQRVKAVGKALECGSRAGEGRTRLGAALGRKRAGRQTPARRTEKICRGKTFPCGVAHLPPSSLVSSTQMCAFTLKLLRISLRHYRFNDCLY